MRCQKTMRCQKRIWGLLHVPHVRKVTSLRPQPITGPLLRPQCVVFSSFFCLRSDSSIPSFSFLDLSATFQNKKFILLSGIKDPIDEDKEVIGHYQSHTELSLIEYSYHCFFERSSFNTELLRKINPCTVYYESRQVLPPVKLIVV